MNMDETAPECARRELEEETGLKLGEVRQLGAFTDVRRDPRSRVLSVAFYAVTRPSEVRGGDDAACARWWGLDALPPLAFDHDYMLRLAVERLRGDLRRDPSGRALPAEGLAEADRRRMLACAEAAHFDGQLRDRDGFRLESLPAPSRITPENIRHLEPGQVFVFGSNGRGMHGGGAARAAVLHFGAVMGQAEGMQGDSYAINSMDGLQVLAEQTHRFVDYARAHPERTFLVTAIGCGIAGYRASEVAPLFADAVGVDNIWLPLSFWRELA
jgi:hypothetical protein